jgi:hypothetical protein
MSVAMFEVRVRITSGSWGVDNFKKNFRIEVKKAFFTGRASFYISNLPRRIPASRGPAERESERRDPGPRRVKSGCSIRLFPLTNCHIFSNIFEPGSSGRTVPNK